ncbi:MAG: SMC family ATPase [Thomasclavelia sp.]|nr:SMC family ATPase [Thomasclavelia sp.]
MIPKILRLQNFGPYYKETTIDFSTFYDDGLFLISGDTGSGKTMIFDAISYALFGVASGNIRAAKSLRSINAQNKDETIVSLEFIDKGQTYKVTRTISFTTPRKEETVPTLKNEIELVLPNKEVISKSTLANEKIVNILGIDADQFKQITMIAQGDFADFLNKSSLDKELILRTIFNTTIYKDLEEELKNKLNVLHTNTKNYLQRKEEIINSIPFEDNYEDNLKKEKKELDKIKSERIKLENIDRNIDNIINSYNRIDKINNGIKTSNLKLEDLKKKHLPIETEFKRKPELDKQRNSLIKVQENLSVKLKKYQSYINDKSAFDNNVKDKNELEQKNIKLSKALETKQNSLNRDEKTIKDASINSQNKETLTTSLDNLNNILESVDKLTDNNDKIAIKMDDISEVAQSLTNHINNHTKKVQNLAYLQGQYELNQYGIIAQKLEENKPCPICGSTNHPSPARMNTVIDKKEIDELGEDIKNDIAYKADLENKLNNLRNDLQDLQASQMELKKEIKFEGEIEKNNIARFRRDINSQISILKPQLIKINDDNEYANKLNKDIEIRKNTINNLGKDIETNNKELSSLDKKITIFKTTYKDIKENEVNDLENKDAKNNRKIKEIETNIEEITENYNISCTAISNEKTAIETQTNNLLEAQNELKNYLDILNLEVKNYDELGTTIKDGITAKKLKQELEVLINNTSKEYDQRLGSYTTNNKQIVELKDLENKYSKEEQKQKIYQNLTDVITGSNDDKISLERYVLAAYFDEVLLYANKILKGLSKDRYQLIREKDYKDRRGGKGLELAVIDFEDGATRSVSTLSGGESFKASLALALGLSTMVEQSSGGVELETLFVDEGFGSLDDKSLDEAINTLVSLKEGGKLVGIISHVSELKKRIDRQIIVSKHDAKSSIEIK